MGWTTMPISSMGLHRTPKAYLDDNFTWSRELDDGGKITNKTLKSAMRGSTYYAAVQRTQTGKEPIVFAVICLTSWRPSDPNHEHFGYKDMDETVGPYEANCPLGILNLLTETDNEYANKWRAKCRHIAALRNRKIESGDILRFEDEFTFSDGAKADTFTVEKHGGKTILKIEGHAGGYRISRLREREWKKLAPKVLSQCAFPAV